MLLILITKIVKHCNYFNISINFIVFSKRAGVFAFFEILFATLFSIDYMLGFYNAKNKVHFYQSTFKIEKILLYCIEHG